MERRAQRSHCAFDLGISPERTLCYARAAAAEHFAASISSGNASRAAERLLLARGPAKTAAMASRIRIVSRAARLALILVALYVGLAYGAAPLFWRHFEHQNALSQKTFVTATALGIHGDALNFGFEGSREEVVCAMEAAGWRAADPVTLASSLKIAGSVIARRAYVTAPVSPLYWEGRTQDFAYQKPAGASPSTRHHVRFWLALPAGDTGRPVWLGSATFDRSVGVSHYTGAVTHHIAGDIDAERDFLSRDVAATGHVEAAYLVGGVGPTMLAFNGGRDPYFTDGEIRILRLRPGCAREDGAPAELDAPALVKAKGQAFGWFARLWRAAAL